MTEFISGDGRLYPIIEERTAWQHGYYLKKYNYNATVFAASKEAIVDSILLRTSDQYKLNRFWIVGAHGFEAHLNPQVRQKLDNAYTLVKEKEFYDAWAQLFVAKSLIIDVTSYFDLSDYGGMVIPIWGGIVTSRPMPMQVGRYTLKINHRGTKASNIYPHLVVLLDDKKVGDFYTAEGFTESNFEIEIQSESNIILKFDFDNDLALNAEDRNAFIKSIIFDKSE